ncbi:MAG: DUF3179 domain-containing protein [Opitutales bacterium]|nr:DUF3179 domain-containing protein [Opitutales bacterium]
MKYKTKLLFLPLALLLPALAVWLFLQHASSANAQELLGFDLENSTVPIQEIRRGGPPPDGIPSIDDPNFTLATEVEFLEPGDIVLGFSHAGEHRAYPFRILIWHEIVNDTIGDLPIAPTYCPLCGTAMVFDREVDGQTLTFGVSGLLWNSDVLMFDRETRSLWSQLSTKAISGDHVGAQLEWLPSQQMTWESWLEKHPNSQVLNTDTGHRRDYVNLPYQSYFDSPQTMFPYRENRDDKEPKTWVVGVQGENAQKAYPLEDLPSNQWTEDRIGDQEVRFHYDPNSDYFQIQEKAGGDLPAVHVFWFAWQAFYPETDLWEE